MLFRGAHRGQLLKSAIANRKSKIEDVRLRQGYGGTAPKAFGAGGKGITLPLVHPIMCPDCRFCLHAFSFGGKGIRTPDFQLAKLALYQLSYAPEKNRGM